MVNGVIMDHGVNAARFVQRLETELVTDPEPAYGGNQCQGEPTELRFCLEEDCFGKLLKFMFFKY